MSRTSPILCIAFAWLFTAGGGCYEADSKPHAGDTNTNWLKCERDSDCDEGMLCIAKMCVDRSTSAPLDAGDEARPVAVAVPDEVLLQPVAVETGPESVADLERCANAAPYELLNSQCAAEPCPRLVGLSSPDEDRLLVLAFGDNDDVERGWIPNVAVLDSDGQLGDFEIIPGITATDQLIGAGRYVAVCEKASEPNLLARPKAGLLYEWRDGVLSDMGGLMGIANIAAVGSRVVVAGAEGELQQPWLTLFEGTTQSWRNIAPDELQGAEATSVDVAQDADGSSSWLTHRYSDMWYLGLARVDANGNPIWTMQLGPSGHIGTESGEALLAPSLVRVGGVTTIASAVNVVGDEWPPLVDLSLRQYDDEGVETRRWHGLANEFMQHSAPVVDVEGNVYVSWNAPSPKYPAQLSGGFVILRFAAAGDPCVLADGEKLPPELILRDSDLVFLVPEGVAHVPL